MYALAGFGIVLFTLAGRSAADCLSYGYDFVDGGGPYCVNTTSTAWFTFGTEFFGCSPSDVQDAVTPILVDPNGDEYFCSDIAVTPDGKNMVSTCNVAGNEMSKNNMWSGTWIAVIEGLTFAYMRSFSIIAAPPVTVVTTPTATFTVSYTPSTTINTTITNVFSTTAPAATVTVPLTNTTRTVTQKPAQVTVFSTSTVTRTRTTRLFSKTVSTTTITTSCHTQSPSKDPTCTIRPTKATLLAASLPVSVLPRGGRYQNFAGGRNNNAGGVGGRGNWNGNGGHKLAVRGDGGSDGAPPVDTGPDLCTTTIIDTADATSTYIAITASTTSTEIDTEIATTTTTITPPPTTAYTGRGKVTVTVTAPTPTRTRTTRVYTTNRTTSTVWATIISTVKTPPSGWVCATTAAGGQ